MYVNCVCNIVIMYGRRIWNADGYLFSKTIQDYVIGSVNYVKQINYEAYINNLATYIIIYHGITQ